MRKYLLSGLFIILLIFSNSCTLEEIEYIEIRIHNRTPEKISIYSSPNRRWYRYLTTIDSYENKSVIVEKDKEYYPIGISEHKYKSQSFSYYDAWYIR
jgi:hypothetical protein